MKLVPGLVIAIADRRVQPRNKRKWHICVSPEQRFFLRINSSPLWPPCHPIMATKNPFLKHDSYVELMTLHFFAESELRTATKIGQMDEIEQTNLAYAALEIGKTLKDDHKELIWENFDSLPAHEADAEGWRRFEHAVDAALHTAPKHRESKAKEAKPKPQQK